MLNKIKKNILPMLETLGNALTHYLVHPTEEFLSEITQFIDAINAPLADDGEAAIELSERLKESLNNPVLSEVEQIYNEYCTTIENFPVQYKAVFLPYYENTWDSLASVYEAFAPNPMFVTEIVIIPIRRNTPKGWKVIYEDYLTPKGIPNTHYSNYSFEKDSPDFVFYNNPYDGVNIEKFQSQNIKPYVGRMVYIPYFLYRHEFQNKAGLEKDTEQFTQLPGHDNSDIFIVQGKSFLKMFSHRSRNGKKMVVLGNPKTDNIYKHMQDFPRHPEWDKITDGKTVFLLNTHYSSAINGSFKYFLSYLIEIIERNADMVLIWRPHPQSFFMFDKGDKSEKCLEWHSYLERVSNHEQMILDRTESSISAIMYSDAVISHNSSIVAESIFADKPIFLLGWEPRERVPVIDLANLNFEDYKRKVEQIRKYDVKNLFLFSSVCYLGLNHSITKEEYMSKYKSKIILSEFMNDIRNGIDSKKELRSIFREQSFVNREGNCGQKIHDYIVGQLNV